MTINAARSKARLSSNLRLARLKWGRDLGRAALYQLKSLSKDFQLSVASGDVLLLSAGWYVTHTGLIRLAARRRCRGIHVQPIAEFSDAGNGRYAFKATVYKSLTCQGFVGYGDADPSNISSLVHGAELRVAETRAVNRALRKAYGIGLCSVEELGWTPRSDNPSSFNLSAPAANGNHNHPNGQPRLRDRLCLLIRQYKLDANLVKAYAADYCGTATLREASRDLVEAFINDLALRAAKDRDGLICQLNSYAKSQEVAS